MGSSIVSFNILNFFFQTGAHPPTHKLFGLLPGISTFLLIWKKIDELIMVTMYFYMSLQIKTTKLEGLLMDPNKIDQKNPNEHQKPHSLRYIFYMNPICIILSRIQLKISQRWKYTSAPSLHKYTMNASSQMFTIFSFLIFLAYIFSESISLKYHYTFSLYKVIDFTIRKSPRP
jgi:uncharacterized membrane protein